MSSPHLPSTDARAEILSRIRSALGPRPAAPADEVRQTIPRPYRTSGSLDHAATLALFADRLEDYGAGVFSCPPAALAATIAQILEARGRRRILIPAGIDRAWLPDESRLTFVPDRALSYSAIDRCDGVLTGSSSAIASTGTIALCHSHPAQGRRALTLIPDYHLCVVHAAGVRETVPEVMTALEPVKLQPITLISGPSATADIEMTRIQGVHGPRVLDVILVSEAARPGAEEIP